jgi:HAD superfamily hydrolase (TIGR01509 family)
LSLAVVTGAGREAVTRSLQRHNLYSIFKQVISADDVVHSKPAPECYLMALQKLGLSANECVAIEE